MLIGCASTTIVTQIYDLPSFLTGREFELFTFFLFSEKFIFWFLAGYNGLFSYFFGFLIAYHFLSTRRITSVVSFDLPPLIQLIQSTFSNPVVIPVDNIEWRLDLFCRSNILVADRLDKDLRMATSSMVRSSVRIRVQGSVRLTLRLHPHQHLLRIL